ncbi:MAG: SDR family NAD(P)-dependent oxidoreductase [Dehalococcoidia bacterium]
MTQKTWLVLGATSPIAGAFATLVAQRGDRVLIAGRDANETERVTADVRLRTGADVSALPFEATAFDEHEAFVQRCAERAQGTLNVFLAFGTMPLQEDIDRDFALARQTIEVNYLAAVSVLSRLAPLLEQQRSGSVVVLGSTAGDRGRLKNYVYGSAKAGLHAYVQGLRARLHRSGVSVTTVKPGFVDTSMTWGRPGLFLVASPERAAAACLRYADQGAEVRYYPWFWWGIMTIIKLVPEKVFKRLSL